MAAQLAHMILPTEAEKMTTGRQVKAQVLRRSSQ
eukprot:CAMPEP_0196587482 /NCGR_PEP_ID=MMETSP1081-20130531/57608_1 /TAXON_ID=36882 /ORGANISM="Pyramimonas amylifera, Strain CCMP720" /LENGTH=33 /DNA_ID= /DNA_START= /DNA_END= /DNA_ORIENTATION=